MSTITPSALDALNADLGSVFGPEYREWMDTARWCTWCGRIRVTCTCGGDAR